MAHIANTAPRAYHSQLRARQAEETRAQILEATLRVMADGLAGVSVPAVAREARVSVATIYRHFGTKRDLLAALPPHVIQRAGFDEIVPPRSMNELRDGIRTIFDRLDSVDDLARAAMASPAAEEARRVRMPERVEAMRTLADSVVPTLARRDRDRIVRLLTVLTTSSALRVWRDHLGSSVDEATDDIDWVIRAAIAASTPGPRR
jgi:hypothetical protein